MLTFMKKEYPSNLDPEVRELCDAINCIPGVETHESCCGHGKYPFMIFLRVTDPKGLFFLARCLSRRYWKYGGRWQMLVEDVSDRRPEATYILESKENGCEEVYDQAASLVENIIHHLNHKNFISGFDIDLSKFDIEGEPLGDDWWSVINNSRLIPSALYNRNTTRPLDPPNGALTFS